MRFLLVASIVVIAIVLVVAVAAGVMTSLLAEEPILPGVTNASTTGSSINQSSSRGPVAVPTGTKFVPSGFRGPVSQPGVIGPTGNPPNY
jgi:hypothetical protein